MSRRMEIAGNILAEILNYMLAIALQVVIFSDFVQQWPGFFRIILLSVIPVFYYMVRELCGSRSLFFLLHILPPVGVIALWSKTPYEQIVFAIISTVFALLSAGKRLTGKEVGMGAAPPPGAAGFFFFIYLVDGWQADGKSGNYVIVMMILYILGYFLYFYFRRFSEYMDVNNRTTEHIPVRHAFYSSFGLMIGFLGISAGVICIGIGRQFIYRIIAGIKRVFVMALTFLFSLIPEGEAQSEIWSGDMEKVELISPVYEASEPSVLIWILNALVYILGIAGIIVLLAAVVIGFIRLVERAFRQKGRLCQEDEEEEKDKVEFLLRPKRGKKKADEGMRVFVPREPSYMVRRQYLRTLIRRFRIIKNEGIEKQLRRGTARECCRSLFPERQKEAEAFAELYEKARYANAACNKADVRRMKHLSGELLK
ncbi:MAG: DUF4129 domain-containing protein [Lachnospiraceae bacterium]|nr:DUF4129 domain-containing protein [Lachnospiraceae bacterium]